MEVTWHSFEQIMAAASMESVTKRPGLPIQVVQSTAERLKHLPWIKRRRFEHRCVCGRRQRKLGCDSSSTDANHNSEHLHHGLPNGLQLQPGFLQDTLLHGHLQNGLLQIDHHGLLQQQLHTLQCGNDLNNFPVLNGPDADVVSGIKIENLPQCEYSDSKKVNGAAGDKVNGAANDASAPSDTIDTSHSVSVSPVLVSHAGMELVSPYPLFTHPVMAVSSSTGHASLLSPPVNCQLPNPLASQPSGGPVLLCSNQPNAPRCDAGSLQSCPVVPLSIFPPPPCLPNPHDGYMYTSAPNLGYYYHYHHHQLPSLVPPVYLPSLVSQQQQHAEPWTDTDKPTILEQTHSNTS